MILLFLRWVIEAGYNSESDYSFGSDVICISCQLCEFIEKKAETVEYYSISAFKGLAFHMTLCPSNSSLCVHPLMCFYLTFAFFLKSVPFADCSFWTQSTKPDPQVRGTLGREE